MILARGIFVLALLVLWAYCIFDVIRTDERSVQNLPKLIWLLIVVLIPSIGSIGWLLLGRPSAAVAGRAGPRLTRRPESPPPSPLTEQPTSSDDYRAKREKALRKYNQEREAQLREEEQRRRRETEDGSS